MGERRGRGRERESSLPLLPQMEAVTTTAERAGGRAGGRKGVPCRPLRPPSLSLSRPRHRRSPLSQNNQDGRGRSRLCGPDARPLDCGRRRRRSSLSLYGAHSPHPHVRHLDAVAATAAEECGARDNTKAIAAGGERGRGRGRERGRIAFTMYGTVISSVGRSVCRYVGRSVRSESARLVKTKRSGESEGSRASGRTRTGAGARCFLPSRVTQGLTQHSPSLPLSPRTPHLSLHSVANVLFPSFPGERAGKKRSSLL